MVANSHGPNYEIA